jgi:hypothetical protein
LPSLPGCFSPELFKIDLTSKIEITGNILIKRKKAEKKIPSVPISNPYSTIVGLYMVQLDVR